MKLKLAILCLLSFLILSGCPSGLIYDNKSNVIDDVPSEYDSKFNMAVDNRMPSMGKYMNTWYALDNSGKLWKWDNPERPEFVSSGVDSISTSWKMFMTIRDGALFAMGDNNWWQLSDAISLEGTKNPVEIMQDVKYVDIKNDHSVVLKNDGTVWTWGESGNGQIGNGQPEGTTRMNIDFNEPLCQGKPVQVMSGCAAISAGSYHTAAITTDGNLYIWGDNSCGQIGNGESGNGYPTISDLIVSKPYKVLENVVLVRLYGGSSFAILSDGSLWAWGQGGKSVPTRVEENVKDVSGNGYWNAFVLKSNGQVCYIHDLEKTLIYDVVEVYAYLENLFIKKKDGSLWQYNIQYTDGGILLSEGIRVQIP